MAQQTFYFEGPAEADETARIVRLTGQIGDVYRVMSDGQKRTLRTIANLTGHPEASVSAQLRHLRKDRFGGFEISKEHVGNGIYLYWMDPQ